MKNEKILRSHVGQKRYIINSVWWRRWCDYVNLNDDIDDPNYLILNSVTSLTTEEKQANIFIYEKPGMINNRKLLENDNTLK